MIKDLELARPTVKDVIADLERLEPRLKFKPMTATPEYLKGAMICQIKIDRMEFKKKLARGGYRRSGYNSSRNPLVRKDGSWFAGKGEVEDDVTHIPIVFLSNPSEDGTLTIIGKMVQAKL